MSHWQFKLARTPFSHSEPPRNSIFNSNSRHKSCFVNMCSSWYEPHSLWPLMFGCAVHSLWFHPQYLLDNSKALPSFVKWPIFVSKAPFLLHHKRLEQDEISNPFTCSRTHSASILQRKRTVYSFFSEVMGNFSILGKLRWSVPRSDSPEQLGPVCVNRNHTASGDPLTPDAYFSA